MFFQITSQTIGSHKLTMSICVVLLTSIGILSHFLACSKHSKDNDDQPTTTDPGNTNPGGGTTEEHQDESTSFLAVSAADLPECTNSRSGFLAYLTDEQKFMNCDGDQWNEVQIGTEGPAGPTGPAGSNGSGSGGISVYDATDTRLGPVMSTNWPYVGILLSNGAFLEVNPATGIAQPLSIVLTTSQTQQVSTIYFSGNSCSSTAAITTSDHNFEPFASVGKMAYAITLASSGGVGWWNRITNYITGDISFAYASHADFDTSSGAYVCTASGGSVYLTCGGGVGAPVLGAKLEQTTFDNLPTPSGEGTLTYPFAAPLYFGL